MINIHYMHFGKMQHKTIDLRTLQSLMQGNSLRRRTDSFRLKAETCLVTGRHGAIDGRESLPVACFSRNGEQPTGLVLLSLPVGSDQALADRLRVRAQAMPQTVMTFTGLSGRTLKVVTATTPPQGVWPEDSETVKRLMNAAFQRAAAFYGQALGSLPESRREEEEMACRIGCAPDAWLNDTPQPVPISLTEESGLRVTRPDRQEQPHELFSNYTDQEMQLMKFNFVFEKLSYTPSQPLPDYLLALAEGCRKSGVEEELAVRCLLGLSDFADKELLVRSTFMTAYNRHPLGMDCPINVHTLHQYRLNDFLDRCYRFRRNKVSGAVVYREVNKYVLAWRPLDTQAINSITRRAILSGINIWDKDVKRLINSNDIEEWDPISDYLYSLPVWDGRDRLQQLADRVRTRDGLWATRLKTWMRSMVSQWMGHNSMYGASMVLMLTGAQGTGKSTFIRLLLPPELSAYYLDRLDFSTRKEAERALTHFALINIDEFDQTSKTQTAFLKHLLQKSNVTQRKMYEDSYAQCRRYASFAATTNCPQPLTDPTGSRRYLVEEVTEPIRVDTTGDNTIDYRQLYAQVVAEIRQGMPCYFDAESERAIQQQNRQYTQTDPLIDAFSAMFEKPVSDDAAGTVSYSALDILGVLRKRFRAVRANRSEAVRLGTYLSAHHFKKVRTHRHYEYVLAEITDTDKQQADC